MKDVRVTEKPVGWKIFSGSCDFFARDTVKFCYDSLQEWGVF